MEKNGHTEHCCVIHGCKYCDPDCPVATKKQRQSFLCEECDFEYRKSIPDFTIPIKDEGKRWEEGIEHDHRSKRILEILEAADPDLHFDWKTGGDGDNGEVLMFQLDVYFERIDRGEVSLPARLFEM